ncbi:hypothetical protein O1M63_43630 [Streptomyces mirabilis]|nr:hypothetical protein [Streptomyces mirabilis]
MGPTVEDLPDEAGHGVTGTDFDEGPCPVGVHPIDHLAEADGLGHLRGQGAPDLLGLDRVAGGVGVPVDVQQWCADGVFGQEREQRLRH